ncbi:MAG: transporter substrate-binding domain-containing protein [Lachnospiraceae bacterium]|nr:transporter substrate-binding domain-containing protein [Lachnospiraceae bacterium]
MMRSDHRWRRLFAGTIAAIAILTAFLLCMPGTGAIYAGELSDNKTQNEAGAGAEDKAETNAGSKAESNAGSNAEGKTGAGVETAATAVRIGWYNSDHFQEGSDESQMKSGYSYEYIQTVANYTGWEYEYVYGGWSDLYDAFIKGDIDLLAGVSFTEEREGLMNYPGYEMGYESYYIYKRAGDESIQGSDLSTLKGKKIGTLENNLMTDYFENWTKEAGVECEEVLFDDFQSRDEAFEKGEIDAFIAVNNNVPSNSGFSPVVMVGQSSYYLAVTKDRTDLLDALNSTLGAIRETNPYFTESLQMKYFQNTAVNAALSPEESKWVAEHKTIKVGYTDNYMPFCGVTEDGQVTGVMTDIFREWQEQLGLEGQLEVEYVSYSVYSDMLKALREGDIDVVFPVTDNIWVSEQEGIVQTNNLLESSVYLIYKGEYTDESTKVIALSSHSPFQRTYAVVNYPESEILVTDNAKSCLDAVNYGAATCTFFNSGRAEEFLSGSEYESLNRLSLGENVNYCLGVKKGNNVVYSLLERGVGLIDKSTMTNEMYKYENFSRDFSFAEFLHDHIVIVVTAGLIIIGLIASALVVLTISLKRMKEQNKKEQEMLEITKKQKEELEVAKDELQTAVEKAETASRAKTTFLFNMSHDIRTPMNAILGFADLAKKNIDDRNKLVYYLDKIRNSGDVLLSILNNVLEMSRIESGTVALEEEPCDINELNETVCTMFEEQMAQKNIELTRQINIKNRYIYCDITKMREIFLNIISNAYKYTDAGGKVSLTLEELLCNEEGKVLMKTTISDTGHGMSKEFLPTLFDEFAREKKSEKNTIEGTGLGMSIVKRLVNLMGGSIEVESELGKGTTFVVTIPHRKASEEDIPGRVEKAEDVDFTGKRILLAEDMDINAEIAMTMLQSVGFEVERAEDGQICVDMLKEKPEGYYDLILMDVQMPNLNGYEASRAIRAMDDPGRSEIPIIAMTANAFEEDKKNSMEAGMNGHLGKPIVVDEMFALLAEVLAQ